MKMIVSDYDNTFYTNDKDIKNNITLANKFMDKNNLFVIATGRSYLDYQRKKELYGIKCNYLIINHGATIIKDNKVIYNVPIDNSIKYELIKNLKIKNTTSNFACSGINSRVLFNTKDLTKIHVRYNTKKETNEINRILTNNFSNKVTNFLVDEKTIEIMAKNVNKAKAIKYIALLEEIEEKDIYTIGDSYSDVEMVKNFNGFGMINSIEELKDVSIKQYESVSNLIIEVMSDNND